MKTKEIKITPPEGYEIDRENSTFDRIVFKPIESERWADNFENQIEGFYITENSGISRLDCGFNHPYNFHIFATKKQAKSALAMARISQLMLNDPRYGSPITDEEWKNRHVLKYRITRDNGRITKFTYNEGYCFLAFHTD